MRDVSIEPTTLYEKNMAALRSFDPSVATMVAGATIPDDVAPATGRDGSQTFLLPGDDRHPVWLGGSSMPTVSAPEILATIRGDIGNLALPGVLTGLEALIISGRLPCYIALYVFEQHPIHTKLVLHLYDYEAPILRGQIVFVLDEPWENGLVAFLKDRPGYELPGQLINVPQQSATQMADMRRRLERIADEVAKQRQQRTTTITSALRDRTCEALPKDPRVVVLSADAREPALSSAHRIATALDAMGLTHEVCAPDRPAHCHPASRLAAVDRIKPNMVLLLNGGWGGFAAMLPKAMPTACWYLPDTPIPASLTTELPDRVHLFASTTAQEEAMMDAGIAKQRITRCEIAAGVAIDHACAPEADAGIAIVANVPDDRPEASGINLSSHLSLWKTLRSILANDVDKYRAAEAERWLDKGQRQGGVKLRDTEVRSNFLGLLRMRIAPAAMARATAKLMRKLNKPVTLWGANWQLDEANRKIHRGPIPAGEALPELLHSADLIVLPLPSTMSLQMALDALAARTAVACRGFDEPIEPVYPGLANILPFLGFYESNQELAERVRTMLSDKTHSRARIEEGSNTVLREHTMAHRMQHIIDTLRARRPGS